MHNLTLLTHRLDCFNPCFNETLWWLPALQRAHSLENAALGVPAVAPGRPCLCALGRPGGEGETRSSRQVREHEQHKSAVRLCEAQDQAARGEDEGAAGAAGALCDSMRPSCCVIRTKDSENQRLQGRCCRPVRSRRLDRARTVLSGRPGGGQGPEVEKVKMQQERSRG